MNRLLGAGGVAMLLLHATGLAQVIEFESNGMKYQTLTKSGVTVMFTHLPGHLHDYTILQAAISNGSGAPYTIRPEDFGYQRNDGAVLEATPARNVIEMLMQHGTGGDVVKLIKQYEAGIYGNPHFKSTNGYETRRQAALAAFGTKLKAAAAASALALVQTKLKSGDSTDGAVFFDTQGKPLTGGRVVVRTNTDTFEFHTE
jgi:hypothetical protein